MQKQSTKPTALDAFMAKHYDLGIMLEQIKERHENFYDADPDILHWGNVGDLDRYTYLMKELLGMDQSHRP